MKALCPMLFELLLNGMDRFLKLRDTEMEMVCNAAKALRGSFHSASDNAHVRPKTFSIIRAYICKNHTVTLRDGPFWGGALPGTSCQATIASSLRYTLHKAPVNVALARGRLEYVGAHAIPAQLRTGFT